ncbi:LysR family transcriptional regulator [Mesorhizobium sp. Cs1321R2N1]|uniref:LysR family transcriptional regulator n=1 Tax=Mesorhizobium sp. Cs1321R2N1 TaxID=3015174 RepID=UPI00301C3125
MQRAVNLLTLRCALVVAEEGSFLGASRRLRIHHSALSRRIKDLEWSLGVALFERHPGGVRATGAGERFLTTIGPILSNLDGALAMVEEPETKMSRPPVGLAGQCWNCCLLDAIAASIDDNPDSAALIACRRKHDST